MFIFDPPYVIWYNLYSTIYNKVLYLLKQAIMTTLNKKQPICLPSLKILGDYWTLRIIDELSEGAELRFNELERRLDDINTATLTKRLKEMQANGLVCRSEHSRADVSYNLTNLGKEAIPLLKAVNHFSAASQAATQ